MAKKAEKYLVIVESPAKAKTIGKYLGPDYVVKASMGHLRDLPKSTLGVDVEGDFTPNYRPIKGKEDIIKELKTAAKGSQTVYLATDPDREGEAISWHLKSLLDLPDKKTKRVTFNEITKNVVRQSIQHPRDIDQNLVDAQQARRILDRLVGYQLSPLLWKKIRRGLSAGRVQSVATRLVVDRENEIRAFQPQEYWTIDAQHKSRFEIGSFICTPFLSVSRKKAAEAAFCSLFPVLADNHQNVPCVGIPPIVLHHGAASQQIGNLLRFIGVVAIVDYQGFSVIGVVCVAGFAHRSLRSELSSRIARAALSTISVLHRNFCARKRRA